MKYLQPLPLIALILLLSVTGFSQRKFSGKVVEVLDGKTVVIEMGTARLTAVLQYIEVPEPEQPLYSMVRDHLEKLVLGRNVKFDPHGMTSNQTFGQLYSGDLDIAQQMLRDGAAWHVDAEMSGQDPIEGTAYNQTEAKAKEEKRGVWGVKDLKPAWEFRAEKLEATRLQDAAADKAAEAKRVGMQTAYVKPSSVRSGLWPDTNPSLKNVGALLNGYNAKTKTGYLGTSVLGITEMDKTKESEQKTAVDITYFYRQDDNQKRNGVFVVTVLSSSTAARFLKSNDLLLVMDEKNTVIAKPKRIATEDSGSVEERLTYEITRASLEKFVNVDDVLLKIGDYNIRPTQGLRLLLYNLLQVTQ